jgi:hypothetical protein
MKTPKKVSISLLGLGLNALFNGVFILLIGKVSDSTLLAQSMILWSGFFVAGACIAPFENYFLYRRMDGSDQYSRGRVLQVSGLLFLLAGLSISFTQNVSIWITPLTMSVGICVGLMVFLRSEAIYQGELKRVSLSNISEGLSRFAALTIFIALFERITLWHILISYLVGNFASTFPYLKLKSKKGSLPSQLLSTNKIFGFTVIGLFTALITGGPPYLSGLFGVESISAILFFFTLSRSLLIFQSVLVYVKPHWAKALGGDISLAKLLVFSFASSIVTFAILLSLKFSIQLFLDIDLSAINLGATIYFSLALVVSALFSLKIAKQNVSSNWGTAATAGVIGLAAACLMFAIIESAVNSFYGAMIFGPLTGTVYLYYSSRRRATSA